MAEILQILKESKQQQWRDLSLTHKRDKGQREGRKKG